MVLTIGDVWRPYIKTIPNGVKGDKEGALILRKKGVNRQSKAVIEVNRAFAEAAKKCSAQVRNLEPGEKIRAYHVCMHNEMYGKRFTAG